MTKGLKYLIEASATINANFIIIGEGKLRVDLEAQIKKLGLENIEIVAGRAEEAAHLDRYRERFDIVLSRAIAPLPTLVELTLPFCAIGGSFIAQKKEPLKTEMSRASRAISLLGGKLREVKKIDLEEFTDERRLTIIDKVSKTPAQYPRRPGIPAKRPIS